MKLLQIFHRKTTNFLSTHKNCQFLPILKNSYTIAFGISRYVCFEIRYGRYGHTWSLESHCDSFIYNNELLAVISVHLLYHERIILKPCNCLVSCHVRRTLKRTHLQSCSCPTFRLIRGFTC